mmetsp:Transcript_8072/g.14869  ORF Transcript_8072/g.14869 Transcript_8072/m.14869 type:complete len:356 (-) Transcript_8072:69-1136(-)
MICMRNDLLSMIATPARSLVMRLSLSIIALSSADARDHCDALALLGEGVVRSHQDTRCLLQMSSSPHGVSFVAEASHEARLEVPICRGPEGGHCAVFGPAMPSTEKDVEPVSNDTLAVGVLSSRETADRLGYMEESWLAAFPKRLVGADVVKLRSVSSSTQVENLFMGSERVEAVSHGAKLHKTEAASLRYLRLPFALFKKWPEVEWYLVVDDQTFVAPTRLLEELGRYPKPTSKPYLLGHRMIDAALDSVVYLGSGSIVISRAAVKALEPHLDACEKFALNASAARLQANGDRESGDIALGRCFAKFTKVVPSCHIGFSQYPQVAPCRLAPPLVSKHYVEAEEMSVWAEAQLVK